jgi:uncharacterized membrane protein
MVAVSVAVTAFEFSDMLATQAPTAATLLSADVNASAKARQGAEWLVTVSVRNTGTAAASEVTVDIPASNIMKGDQETIAALKAGEAKTVYLRPAIKSTATLGEHDVKLYVSAKGLSPAENQLSVEVILPS